MRKLFLFQAALLAILAGFQSCSKEVANDMMIVQESPSDIINATIASNKMYQLTFNSGEVNISKQASHFKVSQVEPGAENGLIVYKYAPAPDFIGSDEVVLSITRTGIANNGGCNSNRYSNSIITSYTTIKINITK